MPNPTNRAEAVAQSNLPKLLADTNRQVESLVTMYYPYVLHLAVSILNDVYEAEDAAQETFVAANRALPAYRGDASLKTWLTAIAVNTCKGRLRHRKVRQTLQSTLEMLHLMQSKNPDPEQVTIQVEDDQRIWDAVDMLDEGHRLVVILRYVHELTVPEISTVTGINEGTVYSRLHYARRKLQNLLGVRYPHAEESDETP